VNPPDDPVRPGELILGTEPVRIGPAPTVTLTVVNRGDRPIQVGSHFHFAEVNTALLFDRASAHGLRLAIPAGTSVRFEPGLERQVHLIPLRGARRVPGLRGMVAGALD
jgi:urease subunit beta